MKSLNTKWSDLIFWRLSFLTLLALALNALFPVSGSAAPLRVVATSTDLGALVQEVGGAHVSLEVLAKGSQNLHYLETKPSYMVLINRADLVVSNGLGLEVAWLPQVLRGARNPKVREGSTGFLELGAHIQAIEVPKGPVSRSHGDVHPEGNPHWSLDPVRMTEAAIVLAQRLAELSPSHSEEFLSRAGRLKESLLAKTAEWKKRVSSAGIQKVITHHRTLNYFLNRFGVEATDYLEPKPGIPPSAQHVLQVIQRAKENKIRLILVEHFYDQKIAERIARDVPEVRVLSVAAAVGGKPEIKTLESLYEHLVKSLEEEL